MILAAGAVGGSGVPLSTLLMPLGWLAILTCVWGCVSWKLASGSLLNLYGAFWVAAGGFNAGQLILAAVGALDRPLLEGFVPFETAVIAGFMATMGLAFTHLGALWSLGRSTNLNPSAESTRLNLRRVGIALLLIGIVPSTLSYLHYLSLIATGGYAELYLLTNQNDAESRTQILGLFVIPGIMFTVVGGKDYAALRRVAVVIALAFAAVNLVVGFRSLSIFALVGLPLAWNYGVRKLPRVPILVGAALIVGVLFPLVSSLRSLASPSTQTQQSRNPLVAGLNESGFSMVNCALTYELIPSRRPYDLGRTYTYAALTVIPTQAFGVHPSYDRGYAADWLIRQVDPAWADLGEGFGNSYIAEAYFNFGWIGAALMPLLIGYLIAWASSWGRVTERPELVACVASMAGPIVLFARGESMTLVRQIGWYALAPLAAVYLLNRFAARHRMSEGKGSPDCE